MSKKDFLNLLPFLPIFVIPCIIAIIIYIVSLVKRGGLKGKDKLKISIFARIVLIIWGFLFLFFFNWKLGVSSLVFVIAFIIHEEWKDYGK